MLRTLNKKVGYKVGFTVVLLAIVALIVWLMWPKSYEQMIPAQSKAVIRIDNEMLRKKGSNAQTGVKLMPFTTKALDLSSPVYGVVTPNEYLCVLAKVNNEDTVESFLTAIEGKRVEADDYDGRHWAWLSEGWLVSWDKYSFLCAGPGVAQERDVLRQTITSMVNTSQRFVDTPAFGRLKKLSQPLQIYAQLDAIPAPYNMLFRFCTPVDCDPAVIQLFASADISIKNGDYRISELNCDITSENADIVKALDVYERKKGCIDLSNTSKCNKGLFFLATRTKGNALLRMLKTDATLRGLLMGLNNSFDADRLLGSADGLMSIEIGNFAKDWTPAFCLKAETHTNNLFDDANYWIESARKQKNVSLKRNEGNNYFLSNNKQQLHFGLQNNKDVLYFASPSMMSQAQQPFLFTKTEKYDKGTLMYFHVNIDLLNAQPCMKEGRTASIIKKFLPTTSHKIIYTAKVGRTASLKFQ